MGEVELRERVGTVRRFNRFYTKKTGLLERGLLLLLQPYRDTVRALGLVSEVNGVLLQEVILDRPLVEGPKA